MYKYLIFFSLFSFNSFAEELNLLCKGTIGWVIEQDFGEITVTVNLDLQNNTGDILLPPQLIPFQVRNKGNRFYFENVNVSDEEITASFVLTKTGLIKSMSNIRLSRVTGRIDYTNKYRQKGFSGDCSKIETKKKKF
tara:strand:+ start:111 stop:521 length:411 start_codon:yes stop_codon:yes gene_type:complete